MGSTRDEELFIQTQQQEDDECEGDRVYLELAKAMTERKCRIIQKKEKLKLLISEVKKLNEKHKSAVNENKCLMKELEEVSNQKKLRVQNIKKAQDSRATLETTLCDLNNKASFEKAETKRKKEEFDAAIEDAHKTWESYKEKYENLPLAKKVREVETELKKVNIEIKQAQMDVADFKMKKKLKYHIAERKFHLSVVKLAETYFTCQKKAEEHKDLLGKITEIKNVIADLKSGKMTPPQLETSKLTAGPDSRKEQQGVRSPPQPVQFTALGVQVTSPPPVGMDDPSGGRTSLFDWGNLLGSSGLLGSLKKPAENSMKSVANPSAGKQMTAISTTESDSDKISYSVNKSGSSMKLTSLLRNITSTKKKPEGIVGNKRSYEDENKNEANKEKILLSKKVCKALPQSTTASVSNITKSNHTKVKDNLTQNVTKNMCQSLPQSISPTDEGLTNDTLLKENLTKNVVKKDKANENPFDIENKENLDPDQVKYSPQVAVNNQNKCAVTQIKSGGISKNLMNILSHKSTGYQRKAPESLRKDVHKPEKTIQTVSANAQKCMQNDQQNHYNKEGYYKDSDMGHHNQQFEDVPVLLEPSSPAPDLIPVEANSLPLSQENPLGNLVLSGGSDMTSPNLEDLDEATKSAYQRMMAETPFGMEYTRGTVSVQKPASEDNIIRSQYFTGPSPPDNQSLTTPPDTQAGDLQSPLALPYSPTIETGFDSAQSMNISSPPPANTDMYGGSGAKQPCFSFMPGGGAFGGSGPASNQPTFNFMTGAPKSKSTFLDLF